VWSICPVQPAVDMDMDNMYFLSVRPDAEANDTIFLHEITDKAISGNATHTLTVLESTEEYGVPPSAFQPTEGYRLQTNDTRVLSASLHQGQIQYVQSTIVPDRIASGIYHGTISDVAASPSVEGRIISSTDMDYAYPSIAFAGETADENSMMMTFSHVSETDFPGTSAIFYNFKDGLYDNYSPVMTVKEGESEINSFLADSIERWGDYTDVQPQYNDLGSVWLVGSYGDVDSRNNVWIAKVRANNVLLGVEELFVYPNPANNFVKISAVFDRNELVNIELLDLQGRVVKKLNNQRVEKGSIEFLVDVSAVVTGNYVLTITSEDGATRLSQKVRVD
ncbi:MAG: T9SS type A sorting domain-containing protein, partial [Bacteroidia bacterium]